MEIRLTAKALCPLCGNENVVFDPSPTADYVEPAEVPADRMFMDNLEVDDARFGATSLLWFQCPDCRFAFWPTRQDKHSSNYIELRVVNSPEWVYDNLDDRVHVQWSAEELRPVAFELRGAKIAINRVLAALRSAEDANLSPTPGQYVVDTEFGRCTLRAASEGREVVWRFCAVDEDDVSRTFWTALRNRKIYTSRGGAEGLHASAPGIPTANRMAYRRIFELESQLREVVALRLSAVIGPDWWTTVAQHLSFIADAVRKRKEDEDRAGVWVKLPPASAIDYLTLGELRRVICHEKLWPHFEPVFRKKAMVEGELDRIATVRNFVAHNRSISLSNFDDLVRASRPIAEICRSFLLPAREHERSSGEK